MNTQFVIAILISVVIIWWFCFYHNHPGKQPKPIVTRNDSNVIVNQTTTIPPKTEDAQEYSLIAPEIKNDEFYDIIYRLAKNEPLQTILEIGSSSGEGSTEAFVKGIRSNTNMIRPTLFCMEVSKARAKVLQEHYKNDTFVKCYNVSSVPTHSFATPAHIKHFMETTHTTLNHYSLETVLTWLQKDLNYLKMHTVDIPRNGIDLIKQTNNIAFFDLVLIDGSEFTGIAELDQVIGAKFILLDDINAYKNYHNYHRLKAMPLQYRLMQENWHTRNGYAVFQRM